MTSTDQTHTVPVPQSPPELEDIAKLEKDIEHLKGLIKEMKDEIAALKSEPNKNTSTKDELRPLYSKDIKQPTEYNGDRQKFLVWHESFTNMLFCRHQKWANLVKVIKGQAEHRIKSENEVKDKLTNVDPEMAEDVEDYRRQLYRHLMDYTTVNLKVEAMAVGETG